MADRPYDVRTELLKSLMRHVEDDPYPSLTMLDQIEELLTPEEVPVYAKLLLDKVDDEVFPSVSMVNRIAGLT